MNQRICEIFEENLKANPVFLEDVDTIVALVAASTPYKSHHEFPEAYEDFFKHCDAILSLKTNSMKNATARNLFITSVAHCRNAQ